MPHSFGYRARTRDLFSRGFREAGYVNMSTYLRTYRIGDYVDIKANPAIHRGMPHKYYHGRTGVVFNVTRRALGVEVNKQVRNRIIKKRIHIRVEHVQPSKCRKDFLARVKENERLKKEAKVTGKRVPQEQLMRLPAQPKPGRFVSATSFRGKKPIVMTPEPFDEML